MKSTGFQVYLHLLGNKFEVSPTVYQSKFNELLFQYDGYTHIFTDGSKNEEAVGSAAIMASRLCKKRLPNNSSIFSAEARGILLTLDMIYLSTGSQLLFLSDSLSCLQSLQNRDLSHPLIGKILCHVHGLMSDGSSVVFMWVPGYVGLAGNSAADSAAKAALLPPVSSLTVHHSDNKSLIPIQALKQWQLRWNC